MNVAKRQNGFTLLEIIITLAILGVISAIAIPGVRNFLPGYNLNAATRDIFARFKETRMTAITRNTTCAISFNVAVDGQNYLLLSYTDPDGDLRYLNDGQHIILGSITSGQYDYVTWDPAQHGGVGSNFPANADGEPSVSWGTRGRPGAAGRVSLISDPGGRQVDVVVSVAGNIRIQQN